MRRLASKIVPIPVLVRCKKNERDGFALVIRDTATRFPVRVLHDDDFVSKGEHFRQLVSQIDERELNFLVGLNLYQRAVADEDDLAQRQGAELLTPFLTSDLARFFVDAEPDGVLKSGKFTMDASYVALKRRKDAAAVLRHEPPGEVLERIANFLLKANRVVLWSRQDGGGQLTPGIFCPDAEGAVANKIILGEVRVCPHCHSLFKSSRPAQKTCKVECREAHRKARWRARQKLMEQRKGRRKSR